MDKTLIFPRIIFCPKCGGHGKIVCPNGDESLEFFSKQKGYEQVDLLLQRGSITYADHILLNQKITISDLPMRSTLMDDAVERAAEEEVKEQWC